MASRWSSAGMGAAPRGEVPYHRSPMAVMEMWEPPEPRRRHESPGPEADERVWLQADPDGSDWTTREAARRQAAKGQPAARQAAARQAAASRRHATERGTTRCRPAEPPGQRAGGARAR